ncbi:unnamed protein product [Lactuca saligna]|uniref:Uncharacterized protein n=1 Tax=Lactuca saligna TaxID=75948 RepID=A0AA35ZDD4_LACSI|nr:unnamed protein product [Lactuca saligna]
MFRRKAFRITKEVEIQVLIWLNHFLMLIQKRKGKSVQIIQTEEEKKRLQAIEMEKQRQINILNKRMNDPPGMNKSDRNKKWCYETIEIEVIAKPNEFTKKSKKSYDIEKSNFNQPSFIYIHTVQFI